MLGLGVWVLGWWFESLWDLLAPGCRIGARARGVAAARTGAEIPTHPPRPRARRAHPPPTPVVVPPSPRSPFNPPLLCAPEPGGRRHSRAGAVRAPCRAAKAMTMPFDSQVIYATMAAMARQRNHDRADAENDSAQNETTAPPTPNDSPQNETTAAPTQYSPANETAAPTPYSPPQNETTAPTPYIPNESDASYTTKATGSLVVAAFAATVLG